MEKENNQEEHKQKLINEAIMVLQLFQVEPNEENIKNYLLGLKDYALYFQNSNDSWKDF